MKIHDAVLFLLIGLGMIACPAVWPEYFGGTQRLSGSWMVFMGGCQALGGVIVLGVEAVRWSHRLATWDPLDFTITLADVRRVVSPSLYTVMENPDEEEVGLRLQQQLLRPVTG